jgi:hypothetical protein
MPDEFLHFPKADIASYVQTWNSGVRCAVIQGGQGDIKHWAFNDPLKRTGKWKKEPPPPSVYRKLGTRIVELPPITLSQNARTSGGGNITMVPKTAITVGPKETWQTEKVSIWQVRHSTNGSRITGWEVRAMIRPIGPVLRLCFLSMFAGCGPGVFAEDVAEIWRRGEATGGGDVFELAVRGAE